MHVLTDPDFFACNHWHYSCHANDSLEGTDLVHLLFCLSCPLSKPQALGKWAWFYLTGRSPHTEVSTHDTDELQVVLASTHNWFYLRPTTVIPILALLTHLQGLQSTLEFISLDCQVRLDTQSVALIPTVTVLLFQPCGIVMLTRSRLALRRIKPYIFFSLCLCTFIRP